MIALTDEELCALDGGPSVGQVAPLPWLNAQDEAARDLACEVAIRGLTARSLIVAAVSASGAAGYELDHDLKTTLDIRRSSRSIVVAQRQSSAGSLTSVLYLRDEGVLEEVVSPGGLHAFSILPCTIAATRLAALSDLAGAARDNAASQPRTLSLASIATGTPIDGGGTVRSVTVVGHIGRDNAGQPSDRRAAVYALADRVLITEPVPSSDHAEAMLLITEVSPGQLIQRMNELLSTPAGAHS